MELPVIATPRKVAGYWTSGLLTEGAPAALLTEGTLASLLNDGASADLLKEGALACLLNEEGAPASQLWPGSLVDSRQHVEPLLAEGRVEKIAAEGGAAGVQRVHRPEWFARLP